MYGVGIEYVHIYVLPTNTTRNAPQIRLCLSSILLTTSYYLEPLYVHHALINGTTADCQGYVQGVLRIHDNPPCVDNSYAILYCQNVNSDAINSVTDNRPCSCVASLAIDMPRCTTGWTDNTLTPTSRKDRNIQKAQAFMCSHAPPWPLSTDTGWVSSPHVAQRRESMACRGHSTDDIFLVGGIDFHLPLCCTRRHQGTATTLL